MKNKNRAETEKMLWDIFRLCDETVWIADMLEFQKSFEKILRRRGYNLWKIYFGVASEKAWRNKCERAYKKYLQAEHKKKNRDENPNVYYVKNRAYKINLKKRRG